MAGIHTAVLSCPGTIVILLYIYKYEGVPDGVM